MPEFTSTGTAYVDEFFAHHGIKGQKWGIRRYQNLDGTLTELGRKKYGKIRKHYTDKKTGEFSTRKSVKQNMLEDAGIGASIGGLAMAGAISWPVLMAVGAGVAIKDVARVVGREKARRFLENTGTEDPKHVSEDRRYATTANILGLISPISLAYGTHREKVARRVQEELKNTSIGDAKKQVKKSNKTNVNLQHSGILGQKWGLRRFQNPDGTLTEAGRKRYAKKGTAKLISDKEKYRAQKARWARDPATLYKHKDEYTKAELDKAMEVFVSQNRIKAQLEADKAAKQKAKEDLKKSKIEYKKLQLQDKMNQAKAEEDYKQLKLKTEQAKLQNKQDEEAAKQKQQFANKDAQIALWKKRADKAKNIMDYAKAGKTILDDMGITSKEEGESLLGSLAVSLGIKDISAAQAKKEAKEKQEKVENAISFMNKISGMYKSLNEGNKSKKFEITFDNDKTENLTLDDILQYFQTNKFVS